MAEQASIRRLGALLRRPGSRRFLALLITALGTALLTVDYVRLPARSYQIGEVADRDVRATSTFVYKDWEKTQSLQRRAEKSVNPVYDFDKAKAQRIQERIENAFTIARQEYAQQLMDARVVGEDELSEAQLSRIGRDFFERLDMPMLDQEGLERIIDARWNRGVEALSRELIRRTMRSYIIKDREDLPTQVRAITMRNLADGDGVAELTLDTYEEIHSPSWVRREISLRALEIADDSDPDSVRAAVALARAAAEENVYKNVAETLSRQRKALEDVSEVEIRIRRGTSLVREGDVLTPQQVNKISQLKETRDGYGVMLVILALTFFSGGSFLALYLFGSGYIRKFSTHVRDVEALAVLTLLVLGLTRLGLEASGPLSAAINLGSVPSSFWYAVPFAAGAMLVRILINSETTIIWITVTASLVGVLMDQQALFALFFTISGVTAAGALAHTRERVGVLRAGIVTGMVNMGAALVINLVQVHMGDLGNISEASTIVLWDVGFAFLGGLLSGILVLGLVPVFELFGFVTDFKLLELANLNHPLLKQLVLRAPGTYHHSMTVAQLCEAAAEAIGANALQVRVACYFHDIGKAIQPQYFIENQRGPNPHDKLKPHTSARIIISHVVDGVAIAAQYKLPKSISDGIEMHHGTGLIQYFYARALKEAPPGVEIDEADFRYPGKKPDSRETGIMMLADKVEAACRTLDDKSPENIRALIQKIVNGAIVDGQLEKCPLTVQQLYTIVDAFTNTLLGIYHHRIAYPGIPAKRAVGGDAGRPAGPIITLEMPPPSPTGETTRPSERTSAVERGTETVAEVVPASEVSVDGSAAAVVRPTLVLHSSTGREDD